MDTPTLRVGQTVAIPVLTRHLSTSSGKCAPASLDGADRDLPSNCVMADAIRDRFPGAVNVNVSGSCADFIWNGYAYSFGNERDMRQAIETFDAAMNRASYGSFATLKALVRDIRGSIPRTVHATLRWTDPA